MSSFSNISAALLMQGQSLRLPITMPIRGDGCLLVTLVMVFLLGEWLVPTQKLPRGQVVFADENGRHG